MPMPPMSSDSVILNPRTRGTPPALAQQSDPMLGIKKLSYRLLTAVSPPYALRPERGFPFQPGRHWAQPLTAIDLAVDSSNSMRRSDRHCLCSAFAQGTSEVAWFGRPICSSHAWPGCHPARHLFPPISRAHSRYQTSSAQLPQCNVASRAP